MSLVSYEAPYYNYSPPSLLSIPTDILVHLILKRVRANGLVVCRCTCRTLRNLIDKNWSLYKPTKTLPEAQIYFIYNATLDGHKRQAEWWLKNICLRPCIHHAENVLKVGWSDLASYILEHPTFPRPCCNLLSPTYIGACYPGRYNSKRKATFTSSDVDRHCMMMAIRSTDLHTIKLCMDRGFSWVPDAFRAHVHEFSIETLQKLHDIGLRICTADVYNSAIDHDRPDLLEWLKVNYATGIEAWSCDITEFVATTIEAGSVRCLEWAEKQLPNSQLIISRKELNGLICAFTTADFLDRVLPWICDRSYLSDKLDWNVIIQYVLLVSNYDPTMFEQYFADGALARLPSSVGRWHWSIYYDVMTAMQDAEDYDDESDGADDAGHHYNRMLIHLLKTSRIGDYMTALCEFTRKAQKESGAPLRWADARELLEQYYEQAMEERCDENEDIC